MFNFLLSEAAKLANIITVGERISDKQYIVNELNRFKVSNKRTAMIDGERYYIGKHDILKRERTVIGEKGEPEPIHNLPNNRIVDNQYKKMVDQKNNYLLGQPLSIQCKNEAYSKLLTQYVFNRKFQRLLKAVGEDSLNCGIGWMFIHYDENGEITFKRLKPYEIIPGWKDAEHTVLEYAIRIYEVIVYEGNQEKIAYKVEVYDDKGINYFELDGATLKPVEPFFQNYFTMTDEDGKEQGYNWTKIPLIPFKYNSKEIPLIKMVKTLQDGLNLIESNFQNSMEEDARNTILILKNYDGQNLGEFRKNLAQYGAVKVTTIDGSGGDVDSLQVEVNSENYKAILELFKKAIIENAMGYDAKDDRLAGNPNQMNIQSMYSDIDLDANGMETEYQAALEELLWFVNCHFSNMGLGDFEDEELEIIFNRDIMISESDVIANCTASVGLISDETIIAMHPWIDDPQAELERVKKQKEAELDDYQNAFKNKPNQEGFND